MLEQVRPAEKQFVIKTILSFVPDAKIIAYGSRIRGDARRYSDLDIAIESDKEIPLGVLAEMEAEFADSDLPYKIDLVPSNQMNRNFRKKISQSGAVWR